MKRRVILACLTLLCSVALITGCGKKGEEANKKTEKTEETTEPEIKKEDITYDWSENELVEGLPLPDTDTTHIEADLDDIFNVKVSGNQEDYKKYIKRCTKAGFDVDPTDNDKYYEAFNKDGRKVLVSIDGTQYDITLYRSRIKEKLTWPTSGLATLVPSPEITVGEVATDSSERVIIYIGEINKKEYATYIDECKKAGFDKDYQKTDTYYTGYSDDGLKLSLNHEGPDIVRLIIEKASK